MAETIQRGGKFKLGDKRKRAILNLAGLQEFIHGLNDHQVVELVRGLVRVVRTKSIAIVEYDPAEEWTSRLPILGVGGDRLYERLGAVDLDNGLVRITLRRRRRQRRPRSRGAPPRVPVVVLRAQRRSRATGEWRVDLVVHGRPRRVSKTATGPNTVSGALQVLAAVLGENEQHEVAVADRGAFRLLDRLVPHGGGVEPSDVGLVEAMEALSRRTWRKRGGWFIDSR